MKKITLAALALFGLAFSASAQIQKGNVMVGGDLANLKLSLEKGGAFTGTISPKAAWFIQDNIALGGEVDFGVSTFKGGGTALNYSIGPLARVYSGAGTEVVRHGRFFGEANIGFSGTHDPIHSGLGTSYQNTNGLGFGVGPGFSYFVTPSIGLETLLKYNGIAGFGNNGFASNLNLGFGFQVYLPGRATAAKVRGDLK
jgi:hypothetical protein